MTGQRGYLVSKRLLDVAVAGAAWLAMSPLLVLIALLVKWTSPGPVFYRWRVVGQGGRYFIAHKFRTMHRHADREKERLLAANEMTGPVFKMTDDPRVTAFGKVLRRYSLDALPQLCSVIQGNMSLVGPRPPLQREYEQFNDWQRQKLSVKPGVTCLWQIQGRNRISDFDQWVRLDLEYISRRNLRLDLMILADTLKSVIQGTGK